MVRAKKEQSSGVKEEENRKNETIVSTAPPLSKRRKSVSSLSSSSSVSSLVVSSTKTSNIKNTVSSVDKSSSSSIISEITNSLSVNKEKSSLTTNGKKRRKSQAYDDGSDDENESGSHHAAPTTSTTAAATSKTSQASTRLDLEYEKLQSNITCPTVGVKGNTKSGAALCNVCEKPYNLIECQGPCQSWFHPHCVGILVKIGSPTVQFKCDECSTNTHTCFMCKKRPTRPHETKRCSFSSCGKYYHEECVKSNRLFTVTSSSSSSSKLSFTCSLHSCTTCWCHVNLTYDLDDPRRDIVQQQMSKGKMLKCIRCPSAFHASDYCLAAGSAIQNTSYMVCPEHFRPYKSIPNHNRVNVGFCFVCCQSKDLIGCNKCPAAYHMNCVKSAAKLTDTNEKADANQNGNNNANIDIEQPHSPAGSVSSSSTGASSSRSVQIASNWTCEDCTYGKRPLSGDIVWAKVGTYRWWPGQICLQSSLPDNVRTSALVDQNHQVGEFVVKFFSTNDYHWINQGRCFVFSEGDEAQRSTTLKILDDAYKSAMKDAHQAFKHIEGIKSKRLMAKSGSGKYNFQFIKTNRRVGNVQMNRVPLDELPRCECDSNSANPCSGPDCLNMALRYECHPAICPAGDRCNNQRFVKRLYPKQEPFKTEGRGWGLRSLIDIKKGDFVNEYVGELIDEDECKRRLEEMHRTNNKNFYFMTISKDIIIDAGPKGNLARFANHSCDPNMQTEKWIVNGDERIGLFAVRDIPANTELTFNYNFDCIGNEKAVCQCGAYNCSGFIGDRPKASASNTNIQSNLTNTASKTSTVSSNGTSGGVRRKLADKAKKAASTVKAAKSKSSAVLKQAIKPTKSSSTSKVVNRLNGLATKNTKKKTASKAVENMKKKTQKKILKTTTTKSKASSKAKS